MDSELAQEPDSGKPVASAVLLQILEEAGVVGGQARDRGGAK